MKTTTIIALILIVFASTVSGQTSPGQVTSLEVGDGPEAVAFDGANIWVANQFSGTVKKVSIGAGAAVATYSVGKRPVALAFDGANIWVANYLNNNVIKL